MKLFQRKKKKQTNDQAEANEKQLSTQATDIADLNIGESDLDDYIPETREEEIAIRVKKQMLLENPKANPTKRKFKKEQQKRVSEMMILRETHLDRIKPIGNIKFGSVNMQLDGSYASILTFVVTPGSMNGLRPLWGIDLIPRFVGGDRELGERVTTKLVLSISRRPDRWAEDKVTVAVDVSTTGYQDTASNRQALESQKFKRQMDHTYEISNELANNASYLDLSVRLAVKARNREDLDDAIYALQRHYTSIFSTNVSLVPFIGEQDKEYRSMFDTAEDKLGENYQLTSTELAGVYPFVTRGINDVDGTYVGSLQGEVNSDPVLLNTLNFDNIAIVCAGGPAADLSSLRTGKRNAYKATTAWGVKYAQDALMHNHKVVQMVLNQEDPRKVGMDLETETMNFNMASDHRVGINMLQSFQKGNELQAYTALINKIQTIARQFSVQQSNLDDSVLKNSDMNTLRDILEGFYIKNNMWVENAKSNREDIRLLNIPSTQIPKLGELMPHIRAAQNNVRTEIGKNEATTADLESVNKVYNLFKEMADNYAYLFDKKTSIDVRKVENSPQVIYNFSTLAIDNEKALMAQFINTFEFGVRSLGEEDVLVIHGMDLMSESVCEYLDKRFSELNNRGVKIVLLYERSEIMLGGKQQHEYHNQWFERSTSKLTNSMTASARENYEKLLRVKLPTGVSEAMNSSQNHVYFLNRYDDNSLFNWDIDL